MAESFSLDISNFLLQSTIQEVVSPELNYSADIEHSSMFDPENVNYFDKEKIFLYLSYHKTAKLLQAQLSEEKNVNNIAQVITNLKGHFSSLFFGKNSNYFISDLILKATKQQKILILKEIQYHIFKMCLNEYASHPIQTLIEKASSKEEIDIILQSICNKSKFVKLCLNQNGTYVIRKILQLVNENFRIKLNELIINNINILVADNHARQKVTSIF